MDYLDFELEIDAGTGREYPVHVINSPAGQARETMRFPFGGLQLENKLQALQIALLRSGEQRRQSLSPEQQTVQDFGRALFDALLVGEVRARYDVSQERARSQDKGLRFKLRANTPEMAALPWEFLYDPRRADYVCLSNDTPIVRYLELPHPIQPLTVSLPLRILGMVASPSNMGNLNVDLEKQRVEEALYYLQDAGLVKLTWLQGQTWRDLQQAMRRGKWHVFHFIGHGSFDATVDEGLVMLCGEDGEAQSMHATELGRLLANHPSLRLALLNACESARGSTRDLFSSTASLLVQRGIPAVLAMQYPITDRAAIELARTLYESLVDGLPVDAAVVESRVAISLAVHNTVEWGTPVLYMRSPDGILFEMVNMEGKGEGRKKEDRRTENLEELRVAQLVLKVRDHPPDVQHSVMHVEQPLWSSYQPIEPELVFIPAGKFLMGSKKKDILADNDERPQHIVYLPDYYIAKMPVTNVHWAAFVQATGGKIPKHWKRGRIPKGKDNHPVVNVSWFDVMTYCQWLVELTGKPYTLPSEAQWEKAARGTDGRLYPWDNRFYKGFCNIRASGTTPVDRYPLGASPYGVLDMLGNVWEWTCSLYRPYPYSLVDGREDLSLIDSRVVRGCAFNNNRIYLRCACRYRLNPFAFYDVQGFRVAMAAAS